MESENIEAPKIPGYYDLKTRKKISNINDFINNTNKLSVLSDFCKQDD